MTTTSEARDDLAEAAQIAASHPGISTPGYAATTAAYRNLHTRIEPSLADGTVLLILREQGQPYSTRLELTPTAVLALVSTCDGLVGACAACNRAQFRDDLTRCRTQGADVCEEGPCHRSFCASPQSECWDES